MTCFKHQNLKEKKKEKKKTAVIKANKNNPLRQIWIPETGKDNIYWGHTKIVATKWLDRAGSVLDDKDNCLTPSIVFTA